MNIPHVQPLHERGAGDGSRQTLNILFVDDHRDTRIVMQKLLEHWGYTVYIADSIQAALDIAGVSRLDLLISDLELSDGSGLDLLRQLQALNPIPGIVHSGYGMEEDLVRSRAAGFHEHLVKPVALPKLRAAIQRLSLSAGPAGRLTSPVAVA